MLEQWLAWITKNRRIHIYCKLRKEYSCLSPQKNSSNTFTRKQELVLHLLFHILAHIHQFPLLRLDAKTSLKTFCCKEIAPSMPTIGKHFCNQKVNISKIVFKVINICMNALPTSDLDNGNRVNVEQPGSSKTMNALQTFLVTRSCPEVFPCSRRKSGLVPALSSSCK